MLTFFKKLAENKEKMRFSNLAQWEITIPFYVISFLLISFLAGFLGGLIVNNYFNQNNISLYQAEKNKILPRVSTRELEARDVNRSLTASLVGIYLKKSKSADSLGSSYSIFDLKGSGFVLTNDGWIITTKKAIDSFQPQRYVVISNDGRLFSLAKIIADPASEAIFAKIKSEDKIENLPPVLFTDSSSTLTGDDLFVIDQMGSVITAKVLNQSTYQAEKKEDLIQSTDKFSKIMLVGARGQSQNLVGAPLFNLKGEVAGVILAYDNNEIEALPVNYFKDKVNQLLKTEAIKRNYLGINYLDLADVYLFAENSYQNTAGVLIAKNKIGQSIAKDSPAAKAGLRENDIILAVEKDTLSKFNNLTEIIQQYPAASILTFKIRRQDKSLDVQIKLGEK